MTQERQSSAPLFSNPAYQETWETFLQTMAEVPLSAWFFLLGLLLAAIGAFALFGFLPTILGVGGLLVAITIIGEW